MAIADGLTLGEIEQVETMARAPIRALEDPGQPMGLLLIATATVIGRRTDPRYSMDDARALTGGEVARMVQSVGGDAADPT